MNDRKQLRDALRKALADMVKGLRRGPVRVKLATLRQAAACRRLKRLH